MGYLANRQHPGWRAEMEGRLRVLLAEMIRLKLVEQELIENRGRRHARAMGFALIANT